MTHPDQELIAQVFLFAKGFRNAESLASKIVPLFNLCSEQLSEQPHYDFGLRALKSVLASAGIMKRNHRLERSDETDAKRNVSEDVLEQEFMVRSVVETIQPKLVAEDISLLEE